MIWLVAIGAFVIGGAAGAAVTHWLHKASRPQQDSEQRLREWAGG